MTQHKLYTLGLFQLYQLKLAIRISLRQKAAFPISISIGLMVGCSCVRTSVVYILFCLYPSETSKCSTQCLNWLSSSLQGFLRTLCFRTKEICLEWQWTSRHMYSCLVLFPPILLTILTVTLKIHNTPWSLWAHSQLSIGRDQIQAFGSFQVSAPFSSLCICSVFSYRLLCSQVHRTEIQSSATLRIFTWQIQPFGEKLITLSHPSFPFSSNIWKGN